MTPVKSVIKISQHLVPISVYSDGSVDVKLSSEILSELSQVKQARIFASLKCPAGLLAYRYLLDHLEEYYSGISFCVYLTYTPNGRQDRLNGNDKVVTLFSLKSVAKLLNSKIISQYLVVDPHSDVTPALITSNSIISQVEVFSALSGRFDYECDVIIAPDAGAFKKSDAISQYIKRPLLLASKHRDPVTNQLTDTKILAGDVKGKRVAIVDDILDGGRTFVALAAVLKAQGASEVSLFVTHGIFSYGYESLKEHIDSIYVFQNWLPEDELPKDFIKTYLNV